MRRFLALAAVSSVLAFGLAATSAPAAQATPLPLALGGCMDTPLPLSDTATIARTCASWDGTNLALWVEGSGLAQEFTAVGTANIDLFGYILTIEARAGMRATPFGGWEAFAELTRPFAFGPLTLPLQVAEDGSRVTLWLDTSGLAAHSTGMRTEGTSSFSITFAGADGTPRGTVAVPMKLSGVTPPTPPSPDVHPSTPATDTHVPAPAAAVAEPTPTAPTEALAPVGPSSSESARTDIAMSTTAAPAGPSGTRIGAQRAALGRY